MSQFTEDLHATIVKSLTDKMGVTQLTAGLIATEIVTGMCDNWAGCEPYIGKATSHAERNRAIIRDWKNGERPSLLARRYQISRVRIWQIVTGTR